MNVDIERKNILVGLFKWLYTEFKDDLPALIRLPAHLVLCVAEHASPEERKKLRSATAADVEAALHASELAAEYAQAGDQKAGAIQDAVRLLTRACQDEFDELRILAYTNLARAEDIRAELHALTRQLQSAGESGVPFTLTPPRNIRSRNDKFVGRESELTALHDHLTKDRKVGVTQETGVHGMGGVGKTELAFEYAWLYLDDYPGGVFSVSADRDLLMPQLAAMATALGIEEAERPEQMAQAVRMRLEGAHTLLIIDNVDEPARLSSDTWKDWLPGESCCRILTTRQPHLSGIAMMQLERLPREQGIELLANHRPDAGDDANRKIVGDIVDFFDGLAVGINVVGVYMAINETASWETLMTDLDEGGFPALAAVEETAGAQPNYDGRVEAIFEETFDHLPAAEQRALEYAALLPADVVVRGWLWLLLHHDEAVKAPPQPGFEWPEMAIVESLIKRTLLRPLGENDQILSLHRLLRRHVNDALAGDDARRGELLDQVGYLAEARGKLSHDAITNEAIRWELRPLLALSERLLELGRVESAASLANWVSTTLEHLARFEEGLDSLQHFVGDTGEAIAELSGPGSATLHSNIGAFMRDLGDLSGARTHMERGIEIERRHFEPDHPAFAVRYSNLATILQDLGDLAAARTHMERAIVIDEKHLVQDHPTLAIRYSNLAMILMELGDLATARTHMERAIEIEEKHLEPDHPTLATSYSNLALILVRLGDLPGARNRIERAIAIDEQQLDADHPSLARDYHNLAHIELAEGNVGEACVLWRRAHAIFLKRLPPDHPNVRNVEQSLERNCGGVDGDA